MSASQTNIDKQRKRHRPSLLGIAASLAFGIGLFILFFGWSALNGGEPEGAEAVIDGRTGAVVEN